MRRFIDLTAKGHGRKERRIRLHHQMLEADLAGDVMNQSCILERHDPRERNQKIHADGGAGDIR